MGALSTTKTPIVDIPHLVGIPAPEPLLYQAVIVASIVPRVRALEAVPVVGKNLFEEVPGRRSCCSQQAASLESVGWWVIALFYHIPSMTSTPSAVLTRVLPPPRSPLRHGDFRAIAKWKILCYVHIQVAIDQGGPAALKERPTTPEDDRGGKDQLHPGEEMRGEGMLHRLAWKHLGHRQQQERRR